MRIVVIGASGGTGVRLVEQGQARGHDMVAVSRRGTDVPGATNIAGDALDPSILREALDDADAVVLAIGGAKGSPRHRERVTAAVLDALAEDSDARVVVHSSLGVGDSDRFLPPGVRVLIKAALGRALADHGAQESLVRASGRPWTIVRPGGLTDGPRTGEFLAVERPAPLQSRISRADVAEFILDSLENPHAAGRAYALGMPPRPGR